ncbi:MAG: FAD-dependent oxidoreductase [Capsulimonadaceae bacterium]|nr:FAD-dependent oxidoreductase [Capsulimonadaceae bacterium]
MKKYDIVIVGGGVGGCAAAIAATSLGLRVAMTEETTWLGGQLTSQAVPPDEHGQVESIGRTRRYRTYRDRVRAYYRNNFPLTQEARENPMLNPGAGYVSALCHDPRVSVAVIDEMTAFARLTGALQVFYRRKPVGADVAGDRITAVHVRNLETGSVETLEAPYILDATELGDLLPLAGVEYVSGAEAKSETGELHAADEYEPDNVQALTWCFAMGYDPDGEHVIDKPAMYEFWRDYVPDLHPVPWSGKLISWVAIGPIDLKPYDRVLMPPPHYASLFKYRQVVSNTIFSDAANVHDVTLVNWPQNDYLLTNIIDKPDDVVEKALREARELSLSLMYWMQTEAPRQDGGVGNPGLYLRGDMTGTDHGLAMAPYIRESRRIRAVFTVKEEHVGADMLKLAGRDKAVKFDDSVGTGYYRIDLHPSTGHDNYIDVDSRHFQIPLGSLLPVRMKNLLPACKNLGVTHITNGCYRLHPVEWNIGESAGLLAAFCTKRGVTPHQVREDKALFGDFASLLDNQGVLRSW